jgi:uncharacterized membrane protein
MKEKTVVGIIVLILLLMGGAVYYLQLNSSGFNFYKSELTINGSQIQEKLSYLTDKEYHTLYRNFQSYIADSGANVANSISIKEVSCSEGTSYFRTISRCYNNLGVATTCMAYTEKNEYGCSFGNVYGFSKGRDYWITAEYEIKPENLIKINNNYYIKFISYNENAHKTLITGKNLIISGDTTTNKKYFPDQQVIIYIPYKGEITGFNIISQEGFEFDNKTFKHLFILFILFLPGIVFFSAWYFFGRENSEGDVPERLSMYPNKRKASEVAVFFNLPFGSNNSHLFPTLLTDFYNRKIIDIKAKDKELYVKINKYDADSLNKIEKDFIHILNFFDKNSKKEGEYFLLNYSKMDWKDKNELGKIYSSFSSSLNKQKKEFLSEKGAVYWIIVIIFPIVISMSLSAMIAFGFIILAGLSIFISSFVSTLLIQFKKDYYLEYRQWQSFKKFLKSSPSMKLHGHKGTIVWGEFLVYATALGVADKVLKEMKNQKIITETQYNNYAVISSPTILSSHTGGFGGGGASGGGGGGFGGAGGGGVGGGGGGGR